MTTSTTPRLVEIKNHINGEARPAKGGKTFKTINPASGKPLASVALGTASDIDFAVESANNAFKNGPWAKMSIGERCQILDRVGDLILQNKDQLARAETLDTGKPINESREGDIPRSAQNFKFFASYASALGEECFTSNSSQRHLALREPLGVCGLITPWNLPLYLATWKIAPCLAMGNSCVLKPAEWTPYTAYLFADIAKQAGVPEGVFNVVNGFGPDAAGEALTTHKDVRSISFTGETTTGKAIMANAASTLKKVSFELGGKGANIIFDDACLETAIDTAVRAAYRNQGQICLAGSRLFVQERIYKQVLEKLVEKVKAIRVGQPLDEKTEMGALISKEHMEKVQTYLEIGAREGKLLTGGQRLKELGEGYFLSPALFEDLSHDSRFCQEEIFGPALPVIPFKTDQEAIDMANDTPYGLSASIWSESINRCHNAASQIKAGLLWVNCWFTRDLRTPFGGQKASGIGREGGRYSLEFFSQTKTISYKYR
ncbi:MAG: aldehyde dehydrogenase [Candidatus Obscuribacterales bacterium]|nr:aldehyde dehydrogenase [Candidatus Obscuribacterales bacterium]